MKSLHRLSLSQLWRVPVFLSVILAVSLLISLLGTPRLARAAANDISGRVVKDAEGNTQITDPLDVGLEDVHVYLYRDNGDGVPNTGDTLIAETLTIATGDYSFASQSNGTYWIVVESDDINPLGSSVEQTYGGIGALVDLDADSATAATPRATAGAAFGGRRMLVADGFTTETKLLDKAEHIIRVVLDGSGAGHTNLDFGFGLMKGLAGGYSEYYIPTQMVTTASWNEAVVGTFGQMAGGIWSILRDLDDNPVISGGIHYIISVAASTDNTTVYYDHWEDGYDFNPLNPVTADQTVSLNSSAVQIFESAAIAHNPRNPATIAYDGRDRIVVAGGPAIVTVSLYPETPGSVFNIAVEILPIKPLQTYYVVPVGEGMSGNGQYDFSQTFLTIQSASNGNTVTVDNPPLGSVDLTLVLNQGQVLDVRHTAPGTVVTGSAPIQVQMISGYYQANVYSEADGVTIFPQTLWDDEYYNPVESVGTGQVGGQYGTELYLHNPTANPMTIFWQDTAGSGTFNLAANTGTTYSTMSGHFVPVGSGSYMRSTNGEKFWAIGQGAVSTANVNGNTATAGTAHTNYDSGYSLIPGYLLRRDYYMAWAPGDSNTPSLTNASAAYVTAVNDGTEVFIDFNGDGVPDPTDFDNADADNNPATGMEPSYILNRLQSIQLRDPSNPYTLSGGHIWSNGPTAVVWAPYPRDATNATPSLDAGYTSLPLPLEWMDAVVGILKSVDAPTHRPVVGQIATFTLAIPAYQAVNDLIATDTLPIGWNFYSTTPYEPSTSVTKNGVTTSSSANPTITGDGTSTREVLTWNFATIFGGSLEDLNPNDYIVIRFTAVTNASVQTGYNQNDTEVCGTRSPSGETQTFCAEDKLAVYVTPLTIDKDTSTPTVPAGGQATYTIALVNTDTVNDLTAVRITDSLPAGFTYVGGSATYAVTDNVPTGDTIPGNGTAPATVPANGATNLTWGNWTLGNGDRLTITFSVNVGTTAGTYDNSTTATATSGGTVFTITDIGTVGEDPGTPLNEDPEEDEDVTVGLNLSGKAWLDNGAGGATSYDGRRTGTEPGQAGMVVYLLNSTGTNILQTTSTDASGNYTFSGLSASTTYIVEFGTPPAGYFTTLQNQGGDDTIDSDVDPITRRVTVAMAAVSVANVDAGFVTLGTAIGNVVWLDEDGNGYQDAGEAGIPNATIQLWDSTHTTLLQTTTTDANGGYVFSHVAPGTYQVDVSSVPAGLVQTTVIGGSADFTNKPDPYTVSATAGSEAMMADFGYNWASITDVTNPSSGATGAIGDRIWNDADGDGIQDPGEAGIASVTVTLLTAGVDGIFGTADDVTAATTTTDAAGNYIFDDLAANAYVVSVTAPGGYTQTGDPDESGICATCDDQTTTPIMLAPGDVYVNADFGYQPTGTTNTIGNQIFVDANGDGNLAGGEPGIPGVTVVLLDGSGNVIATTVTNASGEYNFTGLLDGTYTVWVNDTANILGELTQNSTPNNVADGGQPCGTCNGRNTVTVSGGTGNSYQDFGYAPANHGNGDGLIGDTIFLDRDGGNDYDAGEGLEGVTVRLYQDTNGDGNYDAGEPQLAVTTTDENGHYYFGNLPAGNYVIRVDTNTLPAGVTNTVDVGDATLNEGGVTLAVGGVNLAQDFGYAAGSPHTINGTFWEDTDADGILDGVACEGGCFVGVTVALYDNTGNVIATAITDGSGNYSFPGLPDGTYRVDVTDENNILNGYWHTQGDQSQGSDGTSKADPFTVVLSGSDVNTVDFGYYVDPAIIGDYVWLDVNGNGIQEPADEPPIPNAKVTLTITYPNSSGSVTLVTYTDENGYYSFGSLLLDENYNGDGAGLEPTFTVDFTAYGQTPSPTGQGTADTDSNGLSASAAPVQGQTDNSYDSGFYGHIDLGDLPYDGAGGDPDYPTLFSPGPAHLVFPSTGNVPTTTNGIPAVWLGAIVDTEANGQPNLAATGDDDNGDDEDGLTFAQNGYIPSATNPVTVTINASSSGVTVYFGLWVDWNADGDFSDLDDAFYSGSGISGSPTDVPVGITVPAGYVAESPVYFRLRALDAPLAASDYEGTFINGEVEDYGRAFTANPTAIQLKDFSAKNVPLTLGWAALAGIALASVPVVLIWRRKKQQ